MTEDHALAEELYDALLSCLVEVGMSEVYENANARRAELKQKISARLEALDALSTEPDRYIERDTGRIKEKIDIDPDPELRADLEELGGINVMLSQFAADNKWDDGLMNNIDVILSVAGYEDIENRIVAALGLRQGRELILATVRRILPTEEEMGLCFFRHKERRLVGLLRSMTLYSADGVLDLDCEDNLDDTEVNLVNCDGEHLLCRTWSKLTYCGRAYVELELPSDIAARSLVYYLAESHGQGCILTLVEDTELEKQLDRARDALAARLGC